MVPVQPKSTLGVEESENDQSEPNIRWCQVAGYFDGDGSVEPKIGIFTLHFGLTWADTYRKQLVHLQRFLRRQGMHTTKVRRSRSTLGRPVWHLSIWRRRDVVKACKKMLPHLDKKRVQVKTVIDYFENQVTGTEVVHTFNAERREGKWSGKSRKLNMPWTRNEGRRLAQHNANEARNRKYSKASKRARG